MNKNILKELDFLTNKEEITEHIKFYSIYLLIFERFKSRYIEEVKFLLCHVKFKNGKIEYEETDEYKKISNTMRNGKINIFINIVYWFKDNGVISNKDCEFIIKARNDRNRIGHELLKLLLNQVEEKMLLNFLNFLNVFRKIDVWWINNIEVPIAGSDIPNDYDAENVISGDMLLCDVLLDTIYGNETYKKELDKIKKANKNN